MSLNTMASPAARLPGPLVTLVRSRTVAKGGLDWITGLEVDPVFGGESEEGQQLVLVVGDLRGCLGVLGAVGGGELLDRLLGVGAVFGAADLRQRSLRPTRL